MSTPSPVPARDAARRLAADELESPRYHQHDPGLIQRGVSWVVEQLHVSDGNGEISLPGVRGVIAMTVLVAVLALLIWALRRTLTPVARNGRTTGDADALFGDELLSAAQHRAAADAFAARGEWALALRERMRALVKGLEERGLLDPRPGRTATEASVDAAGVLPGHADGLRDATGRFEQVWYGGRDATRDDQDVVRALDERVRATRAVRRPAAR